MPLTAGSHLGPYDILSPLGVGGMGELYRTRDTKLGRDVDGPRTSEGLERLRRARWKHGRYSAEARRMRADARRRLLELQAEALAFTAAQTAKLSLAKTGSAGES